MTKLAALKIERVKFISPSGSWKEQRPLGVACATVAFRDSVDGMTYTIVWGDQPCHRAGPFDALAGDKVSDVLFTLQWMVSKGYQIVGWGTTEFDFDVLAEECVTSHWALNAINLCLDHIDLRFILQALGYDPPFADVCDEAGIPIDDLLIASDGSVVADDDGQGAQRMWRMGGQHFQVADRLERRAITVLDLAYEVFKRGFIAWESEDAALTRVLLDDMGPCTVKRCLTMPLPDGQENRGHLVGWMERGL